MLPRKCLDRSKISFCSTPLKTQTFYIHSIAYLYSLVKRYRCDVSNGIKRSVLAESRPHVIPKLIFSDTEECFPISGIICCHFVQRGMESCIEELYGGSYLITRLHDLTQCLYKTNSVASVCERKIPTERLSLVNEVSANFCG
jgi:hypothetical protein